MTEADRDDMDALAGEYVLGLLDILETKAFEQRLQTESALRASVAYWQDRLLPLALTAPPVELAPAQWSSIERALGADRVFAESPRGGSLWESIAFWRWASVVATAGLLAVASVIVLRPAEPRDAFIAVLQSPDLSAGWVVQAAPGRSVQLIPLVDMPAVADRSLQFWTLVDKAKGPVSLGLVTPGRPLQVPAGRLPGLVAGQLFEITSEPHGGSPIGRPTGPILWKGLAVRSL